jgi:type II secretory pathway pseudopilin PulG
VNSSNQRTTGESGTSLIDLMFAAAAIITMLLAVSTAVTSQSRTRRLAEERNLAMVACRNATEELRNQPFASLPALDGTGFDIPGTNGGAGGLRPVPGDADGLPGQFSVAVDQSSAGETLYRITVRVDWTGVNGRQHFELMTLVADRKG